MTSASPQLLGAARVRALLDAHGIRPAKSLGQNFVVDPNTIRKTLAVASLSRDDRVVEIGPGVGSLTIGLAAAADHVVAVEHDARLIPVLDEVLRGASNVEVLNRDAMEVDFGELDVTVLVANLPYNIAATLVLKVLEEAPAMRRLTVMVQREVGERLAAAPGTRLYGATSVLTAFYADVRVATTISRNAFWPVPNVDSVVVRIERRARALGDDPASFFRVVKAAFAQRRKTLRNALAALAGSGESAEAHVRAAGLDPAARAEELSPDDYAALARALVA